MTTLSKSASTAERWLPTSVQRLDGFLSRQISHESGIWHLYELRRNIAYNIQYLQYIEFTFSDLHLTSVIWTQSVKSFIITGIGIVEAILYYVLRVNGFHRENSWKLLRKVPTNEFHADQSILKVENHIFQRLETPVEEEMTLDAMLKKIESRKLLGEDLELYKQLSYLRKLRNRVHLHLVERDLDTDWNNFNRNELNIMKSVLQKIFLGPLFTPEEEQLAYFSFLNTNES